nr:hypothetical protein [uncultured Pseudomonas sp.]
MDNTVKIKGFDLFGNGRDESGRDASAAARTNRSGPACIIAQTTPSSPERSTQLKYSNGNPKVERCSSSTPSKPIKKQKRFVLAEGCRRKAWIMEIITRAMNIQSQKDSSTSPKKAVRPKA